MMDYAKQHWPILRKLGTELANKVRSFMVIGGEGLGVIVATDDDDDGEGYWLGTMRFGLDETITVTEPTLLNVSGLVQMAQCDRYILMLTKSGQIYAGQFEPRTDYEETRLSIQLIPLPYKFISIRCGAEQKLALTNDGTVWEWEITYHDQGEVFGTTVSLPFFSQVPYLNPHRIVAVACGCKHSLALTDQGEVYTWGDNYMGQLGDGRRQTSNYDPTRIHTPSSVSGVAAGYLHTLLLTETGEVWACGWNGFGQLGLPTTTEFSVSFSKVAGLPPIMQIEAHPLNHMSIAMSFDHRCFVWGLLCDQRISTPLKLPPNYSTVESPLYYYSHHRNTPHSVTIPEPPSNRLSTRMSRMFDNPKTCSDVQFVVEQRTIHAHRNILIYLSDYFAGMLSKMPKVDPEDPIIKVPIPGHSYSVFRAFLHFLYTDCLEEFDPDMLLKLFELANQYLELDLQKLCIRRMRATLTPATCCLYYQLTRRHSQLPELGTFQQELVQFASIQMSAIATTKAYQSMEPVVRENLTYAVANLLGTLICHFECQLRI